MLTQHKNTLFTLKLKHLLGTFYNTAWQMAPKPWKAFLNIYGIVNQVVLGGVASKGAYVAEV